MLKRSSFLGFALVVLAFAAASARAGIPAMKVTLLPVNDLSAKLEAYVKAHPDDHEARYRLGRVHYLVAVLTLDKIAVETPRPEATGVKVNELDQFSRIALDVFEPGKPIRESWGEYGFYTEPPDPDFDKEKNRAGNPWGGGVIAKAMTADAVEAHLRQAVLHLRAASVAEPANARYHLAFACALEDGSKIADKLADALAPAPKPTLAGLLQAALNEYLAAYDQSIKKDLDRTNLPVEGRFSLVSYMAGRAYLRLTDAAAADPGHPLVVKPIPPDAPHPAAVKYDEITNNLAQIKNLPRPPLN